MRSISVILFTTLVLFHPLESVHGLEVQVDEVGNVIKEETQPLGYKFGPTTSGSSKDLKPWSVLKALFPNASKSLGSVWESSPVYIPVHSSGDTAASSLQGITTLVYDEKDEKEISSDRFSHLLAIDDSLKILSDPNLVHGKDYFVLKYLLRDGEEWNGQLPYAKVPLENIPNLMKGDRFSLVINKVQRRWKPIKDLARSLEMEINAPAVVCNLYLTPPRASRAFESHVDWMDVIVVQVQGEKVWSVWDKDSPFVKLVPPDQKRKPTKEELQMGRFENVRMTPGDVLYIPRGHLHNATTPIDSNEMSLHLTFGIEYGYESTMEALLHQALVLFRAESKKSKSIAVKSRLCGGSSLTYDKLLHYSLSDIVRRTKCGGFAEYGASTDMNYVDAICNLRKNVPLHPQWQQLQGRSDDDVEKMYISGIEAFAAQVSIEHTLHFVNFVSQASNADLGSSPYRYIGMKEIKQPYRCDIGEINVEELQSSLEDIAADFLKFAERKFLVSREYLDQFNQEHRLARWQNEDALMTDLFGAL